MPDSRQIARDLAIAQACDAARNPNASAHMNAAVGRLIETLIKNKPPVVHGHGGYAIHGAHQDARKYLERLARLFDDVIENVASEAELQGSYDNICSNALHDSDLPGDLTDAGERLIEDAREESLEMAR